MEDGWELKLDNLDYEVFDFVQSHVILDIDTISEQLKVERKLIKKSLQKLGFEANDLTDEERAFILEIMESYGIDEAINVLNNINKELDPIILRKLKNLELNRFNDRMKIQVLWMKVVDVDNPKTTLKEIDELADEYRRRGFYFYLYELLSVKCILLWNLESYNEIVEIYKDVKDALSKLPAYISSRFLSNYCLLQLIYNNKAEFKKTIILLKKLSKNDKEALIRYIAVLMNYGNIKEAYKLIDKVGEKAILLRTSILVNMGFYDEVAKLKGSELLNRIQTFSIYNDIAIALLMLGKINASKEHFKKAFEFMNNNVGLFRYYYYTYFLLYFSVLDDKKELRNTISEIIKFGNDIQFRFYKAILEENDKYLGFSLREKLLKLWIQGRLRRAVNFANKYGLILMLHKIALIVEKSPIRMMKYKEFEVVKKIHDKEFLNLYLMRKKPKLRIGGKILYLRYNNRNIDLIKLLINKSLPIHSLSKASLRYASRVLKNFIDISEEAYITLKVDCHSDLDDLRSFGLIAEKVKHIDEKEYSKILSRMRSIFLDYPFGLKEYKHPFLSSIICDIDVIRKKYNF